MRLRTANAALALVAFALTTLMLSLDAVAERASLSRVLALAATSVPLSVAALYRYAQTYVVYKPAR